MDRINTILGDLGFSPGDDVIDSDLLGEIEHVLGAARLSPDKSKTLPQTTQVAPSKRSDIALPKKTLPQTTQVAPSPQTNMPPISKDASRAAKLAASNKRITTAQANLRTAVRSTLDKAGKLKIRASRLSANRASARVGARLTRMSDQLTRAGMQLKKLADKKQLTKTVQRPLTKSTNAKLPSKTPLANTKLAMLNRKSLLGTILDEVFGEDVYDPYTSERDPQTIAEAETYIAAAQQAYDAAKQEELAAADEVKRLVAAGGTGENPELDDAVSSGMQAALARGDAGQTLAYGNELLAALKEQPAPPSSDTNAPPPSSDTGAPPPSSDTGAPPPSSDTGAPPPSSDTGAPPPSSDTAPPGAEGFPPGAEGFPPGAEGFPPGAEGYGPSYGYPPYGPPVDPYGGQPMLDPYGGFIDPFTGVPSSMERPTRGGGGGGGGGGWDDFADSGYDPDSDIDLAEQMQTAAGERAAKFASQRPAPLPDALPEFESEPGEAPTDEDPGASEEELVDDTFDQGVVGSYLAGTSVLIGCVLR